MTDARRWYRMLIRTVAIGFLGLAVTPLDSNAQPRHGMWVYGVVPRSSTSMCRPTTSLLDEDPNAVQLLSLSATNFITEVYLSVGPQAGVLSDERFPNFMRQLKGVGLRVEALVGCGDPSDCRSGTWATRIDQVVSYNNGQTDPLERFDGLHLDLEPWVNTGTDYTWVDELIGYYQDASSALQGSGLTLAADMSGVKIINNAVDPAKRQSLLDLATRLVLLEYEEPSIPVIYQRVDRFRNAVDLSADLFAVATRVQDFGAANACQNGTVLKGFDDTYTPAAGYAGWSTYKYSDSSDCNHYNDPAVCPGDCCVVPQ